MSFVEHNVRSLTGFLKVLNRFQGIDAADSGYRFRGQKENWRIRPSLHRYFPKIFRSDHFCTMNEIESWLTDQFLAQAHRYLPTNVGKITSEFTGVLWPWMQHFGAPTRLVDWTKSPLVAAYFASNGSPKKRGCIWYFELKAIEDHAKSEWENTGLKSAKQSTPLLNRAENPHSIYVAKSELANQREIAQEGLFTLSYNPLGDHTEILKKVSERAAEDDSLGSVGCIQISPVAKQEIRSFLRMANIGAANLYPGLEGIGLSLQEEAGIRLVKRADS